MSYPSDEVGSRAESKETERRRRLNEEMDKQKQQRLNDGEAAIIQSAAEPTDNEITEQRTCSERPKVIPAGGPRTEPTVIRRLILSDEDIKQQKQDADNWRLQQAEELLRAHRYVWDTQQVPSSQQPRLA